MAHAERCPICNGSGKIKKLDVEETCHGCGGKGWVEVSTSYPWSRPYPKPCPRHPYEDDWHTWYRW